MNALARSVGFVDHQGNVLKKGDDTYTQLSDCARSLALLAAQGDTEAIRHLTGVESAKNLARTARDVAVVQYGIDDVPINALDTLYVVLRLDKDSEWRRYTKELSILAHGAGLDDLTKRILIEGYGRQFGEHDLSALAVVDQELLARVCEASGSSYPRESELGRFSPKTASWWRGGKRVLFAWGVRESEEPTELRFSKKGIARLGIGPGTSKILEVGDGDYRYAETETWIRGCDACMTRRSVFASRHDSWRCRCCGVSEYPRDPNDNVWGLH